MLTESTYETIHVTDMSDCMHKLQMKQNMEVKPLQGKADQTNEASITKELLVGSISEVKLSEEKREEESQDSGYDEWRASGSDEEREDESDECGPEDVDDVLVIDESLTSNSRSQKAKSSSQLQRGRNRASEKIRQRAKNSSQLQRGRNSVSEKIRRRAELRSESVKKMRDGKSWLVTTLVFVDSALSCVSLREVVDQYRAHCRITKRGPVTTPVLARLIRSVFPGANKCRVGPRGSQKIHYRSLQWLQDASAFCTSETQELEVQSNQYELQEGTHRKSVSLTSEVKPLISGGSVCNQNQEQAQQEEEQQEFKEGNHESLSKKQIKGEMMDEKSFILISKSEDSVEGDSAKKEKEPKEERSKDLGQQGKNGKNESCEETEGQQEDNLLTAEAPEGGDFRTGAGEQDNQGDCEAAAEGLSRVIKWMFEQNKMNNLLLYFSHSASCRNQICSPICLMFRRVRRHVVGARHACSVLQVYATLLRTHVASCNSENCGLPACPALRATQLKKRMIGEKVGTNKRSRPLPIIIQAPHPHPQTITYTSGTPTTPPANGTTQIVYVPVMMHLADPRGV